MLVQWFGSICVSRQCNTAVQISGKLHSAVSAVPSSMDL